MKYNFITLISVLLISMTACVSEEVELRNTTDRLTVTATYTTTGMPTTKTTLTPNENGIHVAWAENDKIRVMQSNAAQYTSVDLLLKNGAGTQIAEFEGNNFPDIPGASNLKYQAFYPASIEGTTPETWKQNATYQGQVQKGYDNTEHLAAFDYLMTPSIDNLEQPLQFMHLGLIFCFDITMPKSAQSAPQSFTLTTLDNNNTPTTEGGLFENCNRTKTSSLTLNFQECTTTTPTFKAYLICNCNIPAEQKIMVTLTLQDGSTHTCQLTAQQAISSVQADENNEGISYVIPISEWEETKNSIFSAETIAEKFAGTGTLEDPYIIENAENLKYLIEQTDNYTNKYFALKTDITIQEGTTWTPIGKPSFNGNFDGNGHTIKGDLKTSSNLDMGLFGNTNNAQISNLNSQINITNESCTNIGGIIAQATNTTITNCHYNGNINVNSSTSVPISIGGIVANASSNCQIKKCSTHGSITQNSISQKNEIHLGGIAAKAPSDITILQCYNYAKITGGKQEGKYCIAIGGIIGKTNYASVNNKIEKCYNYGEIYGSSYSTYISQLSECNLGGIIGDARKCQVSHCYNHGIIQAQPSEHRNSTGGIIGHITGGSDETTLNNCTNHGKVIGNANSKTDSNIGGLIGKISLCSCKVHQCLNAGNVSVITEDSKNQNIFIGSYIGFISDPQLNLIYNCCSTASRVVVKDTKGETIPTTSPTFYIGNGHPLTACPDSHTAQHN